jgi:hypothetical protein
MENIGREISRKWIGSNRKGEISEYTRKKRNEILGIGDRMNRRSIVQPNTAVYFLIFFSWILRSEKVKIFEGNCNKSNYIHHGFKSWLISENTSYRKGKDIPITSNGGFETLRLSHFLDSRLTDGGECQPYAPATHYPQEDSWYSFPLRVRVDTRANVRLEGLGQLKNSMNKSGIEPATFRFVT